MEKIHSGKYSSETTSSLWLCLWVPDLRQTLTAKDLQLNIKNEYLILGLLVLSYYFWSPKKRVPDKVLLIPTPFI